MDKCTIIEQEGSPYYYSINNKTGTKIEFRDAEFHEDGSMTLFYDDGTYVHKSKEECEKSRKSIAETKKIVEGVFLTKEDQE